MLGSTFLKLGDYRVGFPLFENRVRALPGSTPPPAFAPLVPEWTGQNLRGKVLYVVPEYGVGDQIMFARFARWLFWRYGCRVIFGCSPEVLDVLSCLNLDVLGRRVVSFESSFTLVQSPAYWTRHHSVPRWAEVDLSEVPAKPYLKADPARDLPAGVRIGFASRGNPAHPNDKNRSLPPAEAARLHALPGAMSLRLEDTGASNFKRTAEIIAALDLVITVDTSVAHLAGAMGKPVWILLPAYATDWRWMQDREDSPWYPSAKLYRQREPGAWGAVIDRIEGDLAATHRAGGFGWPWRKLTR